MDHGQWSISPATNPLATVVVNPLATVPPEDRFLSPVPDGRGSYERGYRNMLVYRLELFQLKCIMNVGTWAQ